MLTNVQASDGGEYTCVVSNVAGSHVASTYLFVSPYFTVEPVDKLTSYEDSISLPCEAEAFPSVEYQWVRADGGSFRESIETNTSMLVIESVMFGDEGDYICLASSLGMTIRSPAITITSRCIPRIVYLTLCINFHSCSVDLH